ncbi:MAG: hypothetical protein ABSF12_23115 [Bryobacteraceae bacterium]
MQEKGQPRLISIVRRSSELLAFISEPELKAEQSKTFETKSYALDRIKQALYPRKEALQESWRYLANVKTADEATLYHVLVDMNESVPDLSIATSPPLPPDWGAPTLRAKATSAHPRAFKGTKSAPPKAPRPATIDIRPHLSNLISLQALLSSMRRFLPEVQSRLERNGYSKAAVEAIENEFPRTGHARQSAGRKYWTMPARFVQYIWPLVRWRPAHEISQYLSLFVALELEKDERLLWSVSRLNAASEANACSWCLLAKILPAHRRVPFVNALLESKPCAALPQTTAASQLEQINELLVDAQFPERVSRFLEKLRNGLSVEYLLAGARLAAQFAPNYSFSTVGECEGFPERVVEEIGIELESYQGWLPMALWERCGRFPGMAEILAESTWRSLIPEVATRYFRFLIGIGYSDLKEAAIQLKWQSIKRQVPALEALLASTPLTHQTKAAEYFSEWLSSWDSPKVIDGRMPAAIDLIRRLAAPPFETGDGAARALGSMLGINESANLNRFLSAPDRSFKVLERGCRRGNDANLISWGLWTLLQRMPSFTVEAFCAAPTKLIRTAKVLGGVQPPVRAEICRTCGDHPLFLLDPLTNPIRDTCAKIWACGKEFSNPIPARLKSWCRDEIRLSTASLARYQRVLADKIVLTKLDLIEHSMLDRLKLGLPVQTISRNGLHALRLLGDVRENRRGLRKFLQAYWSGDLEYLSRHPETQSWYRRHQAIPRDVWEHGIPFDGEQLTIQIERDPLEILKLGTYTGTCLGVGGMCSDSAIAALLDVNKKVLYARDRKAKVVARQLIAVADDDRLVCFNVYPLSSSPAARAAFRDYDHALARALGIPIYEAAGADDPGYQVSSVLSLYWWDDGGWDFNADP